MSQTRRQLRHVFDVLDQHHPAHKARQLAAKLRSFSQDFRAPFLAELEHSAASNRFPGPGLCELGDELAEDIANLAPRAISSDFARQQPPELLETPQDLVPDPREGFKNVGP